MGWVNNNSSHRSRFSLSVRLVLFTLAIAGVLACACPALAADWPMFRGNPALTGVTPGKLERKLPLLWTFNTTKPVKSSPAIAGDHVFVGSDDGNLYSINFGTGKKEWAYKAEGPVESSPLVLDGRVY